MLALRPWWSQTDRTCVTFGTDDARHALADEADVVWCYYPTTRNLPNLVRNALLAVRVIRRTRPTAIVSTGAAVAFPFFVLGRLRRIKTVYIEVYDRVETPTLTGRLCRRFSGLMLVQWPEQQKLYDEAIVVGPLL